MKKFYMTMVAMLCGAAAWAQTVTITADDVSVVPDGKTVAYVMFYLNESENGLVTAAQAAFKLPDGVSVYKYYDEDEEEWAFEFESPVSKKGHNPGITQGSDNPQGYNFTAASTSSTFKTGETVLAKISIIAAEGTTEGEYDVPVTPAFGLNGVSVYPQDPFTFKLTVGEGTAISSISADEANAPMYNLAGQRVSKAQNGIFVQKGKKVAVK